VNKLYACIDPDLTPPPDITPTTYEINWVDDDIHIVGIEMHTLIEAINVAETTSV